MEAPGDEAAGLLRRCRLLTMSAGTTQQTWSIDDYYINSSDIRFRHKVVGCGSMTKVEEADLYGMVCAVKMSKSECEKCEPIDTAAMEEPVIQPSIRGSTFSNDRTQDKIKLPLRKMRSHSSDQYEKGLTPPSLGHTSRLSGGATLDGYARVMKECRILSTLHHPNIVQFFGVSRFYDDVNTDPFIVEELMLLTLDDVSNSFKERIGSEIPCAMQLSLLTDTARGLTFLHNHEPSIIHPTLHARDVMISSAMVAKITDLSNAQFGSIKHQDILAYGTLAAQTLGLSSEDFEKKNVQSSDFLSDMTLILLPCFSPEVQSRPAMIKILEKLERLAKHIPFNLSEMTAMMSAIRGWRQEAFSHTETQSALSEPVRSASVNELLNEKNREVDELKNRCSELMEANKDIERRLEDQEMQLSLHAQATNHSSEELELSDVLTALHDVVGWFLLGIHLGVPLSGLQKIRHQYNENVDQCKTEMIITYTKQKEPSWADIVEALRRSGERALAVKISQKYGVPLPAELVDNDDSDAEMLADAQEASEVTELVTAIKSKDQELQNTIQHLEREQAIKEDLEREIRSLRESLSVLSTNDESSFQVSHQQLSQQLFLKEREKHYLTMLSIGEAQDKSPHGNEIELILVEKDMEINRMKNQLREMETKFSEEKVRSTELSSKISTLNTELDFKNAQIVELEKSKEELNKYLVDERQRVDLLLMKVVPPQPDSLTIQATQEPAVAPLKTESINSSKASLTTGKEPLTPSTKCCIIS